jgi:gliding motility-associated-like protein
MFKTWALPVILFLLSPLIWADTPVKIRRICEDGRDNHLYFNPSTDPCGAYFQYKVWGRNGNSGPFILLDSINVQSESEYIHVDASPGIATNWSYFIVIIDSCGPTFETISDTVSVDREIKETVFLDSASIDPITNEANLGWHNNLAPDFSHFKVYSIQGSNNILISTGLKDTTFHVIGAVTGPKTFNISSVDSCGNETPFLTGKHTTMFLSSAIDTCLKTASLSWTPYIGWTGIRIQYIYVNINGAGYILLDSVTGTVQTFTTPISLGLSYSFFIRAFKDTEAVSSSSNSITFATRLRIEPDHSYLSAVSVGKPNDPTTIIHVYNPNEEVKKYSVRASSTSTGSFSEVGVITGASSVVQNYSITLPFIAEQKYFKVVPQNDCGMDAQPTNTSRYSSLTANQTGNYNTINWEPYLLWNVGVDFYNIYRGTNDQTGNIVFSLIDVVSGADSLYLDQNLPAAVGENGLCYYVEAIQQNGDVNQSIESAFSTISCVVGELTVYIPNAFNPNGVNTSFRPEGSYIDYDQSQMEIYDRWGKQLTTIVGIRSGWDGKDADGVLCMQGVYLYRIIIKSTNGIIQNFKGTVTLLN